MNERNTSRTNGETKGRSCTVVVPNRRLNLSRTSDLAHRLAAEIPGRRDLAPLIAFDVAILKGPAGKIPAIRTLAQQNLAAFEAALAA
jgi:hypothetical protein